MNSVDTQFWDMYTTVNSRVVLQAPLPREKDEPHWENLETFSGWRRGAICHIRPLFLWPSCAGWDSIDCMIWRSSLLNLFQEAELNQQIDSRLVDFIHQRVSDGVRHIKEMKRHLKFFVEKELFANENGRSTTNSRYYPKNATIRNHSYLATVRLPFGINGKMGIRMTISSSVSIPTPKILLTWKKA